MGSDNHWASQKLLPTGNAKPIPKMPTKREVTINKFSDSDTHSPELPQTPSSSLPPSLSPLATSTSGSVGPTARQGQGIGLASSSRCPRSSHHGTSSGKHTSSLVGSFGSTRHRSRGHWRERRSSSTARAKALARLLGLIIGHAAGLTSAAQRREPTHCGTAAMAEADNMCRSGATSQGPSSRGPSSPATIFSGTIFTGGVVYGSNKWVLQFGFPRWRRD
jgi:hypothetical protein